MYAEELYRKQSIRSVVFVAKVKEFICKNFKQILFFLCIILFLALAEDVFNKEIMNGDVIGYKFISDYIISDRLTPFIKVVTNFGGAIALGGITVLLLLIVKNKRIGVGVLLNLSCATGLNLILKSILQRPRPTEFRIIDETGYSFPSGHSMISMAFCGLFIYLIYKNVKNKYLKWTSIVLLSILIMLIGFSRIYLGVHYVSDVLAGFLFSVSYLIVYIGITDKFLFKCVNTEEK